MSNPLTSPFTSESHPPEGRSYFRKPTLYPLSYGGLSYKVAGQTGVARQRSRTVYGTKKAADDALAAFVIEVRTGTTVTSTDSLNALLDRWLEHVQGDLQPTTLRGYRDKLVRVRRETLTVRRHGRSSPPPRFVRSPQPRNCLT
jgi:hypothetical protein